MYSNLGNRNFSTSLVPHAASALSNEQIMRYAPSVFAEAAHESRSERYAYIPTIQVLEGLRKEGFGVFQASQSITRKEGHSGHTKHMLRLRHVDSLAKHDVNEVILINSHNGTSSYRMLGGVFRFVCLNGMVAGTICEDIRVHHKGDVQAQVIEAAFKTLDNFKLIDESKDAFKATVLSPIEQQAYARAALVARFDVETPEQAPVSADSLLQARRWEDRNDNSIWGTFQRIQENTVRGGISGRNARTRRRTTTREVTGIDGNVTLNRALWTLAESLRANRSAA